MWDKASLRHSNVGHAAASLAVSDGWEVGRGAISSTPRTSSRIDLKSISAGDRLVVGGVGSWSTSCERRTAASAMSVSSNRGSAHTISSEHAGGVGAELDCVGANESSDDRTST